MVLKVADRGLVPPFIVMDVMRAANERAAAGEDVLHLEVGQPSTPAPEAVLSAAKRALDDDLIGYTDALGVPLLRERIADHYRNFYGVTVPPERIVVTIGSSGAFLLAFLSAFDHGDRVGLANPGYPAYKNILRGLGVDAVGIQVDGATRFQPDVSHLDALMSGGADHGSLDGLIVASPSNPTGSMIPDSAFEALVVACGVAGTRLISDEIYHGIGYGLRPRTALEFDDNVIVVNSFSKYFSMTGWRLGWMIVPEELLRSIECLAQNLFISPPTLSQLAATSVFDCIEELDANVARYAENRAVLLEALPKAGFDRLAPADGAFYIYANVAHLTNDSEAFCKQMLKDTGVATTPGIDFDPQGGHKFLRFSFAGATADMVEASRRLADWTRCSD